MSCKRHTITITYPEDFESLFRKIIDSSELTQISTDDMFALELSLGEAITNALVHGNKKSTTKKVDIEYGYDNGIFDITITDQGNGFSSDKVPDPIHEDNLTKDHGRGIMLMKHYMDEVSYNSKGNSLHMKKRIVPRG